MLPLYPSYQSIVVSESEEAAAGVNHTLECRHMELSSIVCPQHILVRISNRNNISTP